MRQGLRSFEKSQQNCILLCGTDIYIHHGFYKTKNILTKNNHPIKKSNHFHIIKGNMKLWNVELNICQTNHAEELKKVEGKRGIVLISKRKQWTHYSTLQVDVIVLFWREGGK
ncbi:unnamed protein product [Phytomonas sp. EM1]|nr:unnamed protein product [Phytomonas sp. EM1]|eukprot:CCW60700.1 unnamed protein product [Phytomonas sp. isolate EM1]